MAKTTNTRFQILCKLLECSAGGGNRTIHAYSFYVTYCKHTNARTAKPSVCPPPVYKIMYNNSKAECVVGLLTPGCAPPLPVYRTASGSFPTATFQQVDATRVGPAACCQDSTSHIYCGPQLGVGVVSYKASVVARVRNGFVPASRRQVFTKLKPLLISKCPFVNLPETHKGRWGEGLTAADMDKCVWVRPEIVTRIEFLEWTESEKTVSDYTRSSSTVREVSDHASHPSPLWP